MVDDTIPNNRNRSTNIKTACGTNRESVRPSKGQPEIVRSCLGGDVEGGDVNVSNELAEHTGGTSSFGRESSHLRGGRSRGRGQPEGAGVHPQGSKKMFPK